MTSLSAFDSRLTDVAGVSILPSSSVYGGETGLPLLSVENAQGKALIALQGAHLVSFVPAGGEDLLWLSPKVVFTEGKAIRGGIPLCLPWFGGHPGGKPAHGFARISEWQLEAAELLADGTTRVTLVLTPNALSSTLWGDDFRAELVVTVGHAVTLALSFTHLGASPVTFSQAFHTYFAVGDVAQATISGLDGTTFINTVGGANTRNLQAGSLQLGEATDRVYVNVPEVQTIATAGRTIRIASDTRSAVVWNPWAESAAKMADVGDAWREYLCVERGDVFDNAIELAPGATYRVAMTLSLD
ncbi:D-hexose-6-phosphate mutarotase [Jeongeupia naejangsanensis]|uniref:Putative glucose-6-phosphate 1-epimerase n=1 Tax=Jeongeupia naejangsanensis TaxID=613195 RepID=A0ABS2BJP8_9NEIS|nr:D-hexose-6-phosphate mutarotase [Jeongeupia naejangsanensis]MBM3115313.1 D-hexose-6-phosphate mutarotase [Jeongeupia naejangsanensis]